MATTILSGQVSTADPLSNQLVVDMRDTIRDLDVDTDQFSTMLMDDRLGSEEAKSYIVEWLEDVYMPRVLSLGASATSAATVLTTGTGEAAYAKTGDVIRIPESGEAVRVTASDASTSLTVLRAIGGTAAATAASGSAGTLIIVGGTNAQGATAPPALITKTVRNYNYTGITRNVLKFARTTFQSDWYGGDILMREREKKAVEHKADLENTLFFGARAYSASDPPRGHSGGLVEFISTNVTSAGGTLDKGELNDFLRTGLQYGSNDKVLFAAPIVAQVCSEFLQDNWVRARPEDRLWGAKVDAVISAVYGTDIPVVVKRQWGAYGTGTGGQYGSLAFLVDMQSVRLAPMQSTVLNREIQAPDADEKMEEYLFEGSLKVMHEQHHSKLTNVTG